MLKKISFLFFAVIQTGCWAFNPQVDAPAPENELKKIVEKFDKVNNPDGIKCRSYHIKLSAVAANIQMVIQMETYGNLEKKQIRTTLSLPGMPMQVQLYDGRNGYNIVPGLQSKVLQGDAVTFLRYSAKYAKPWSCLSEEYEKMVLDQKNHVINGKNCYRIVARPAGEPSLLPVELFIDRETYLPVRTRSVSVTEMGKIPNTIDYLTFRKIHGVMVGKTVKIQQLNIVLTAELQDLKLNCPIPDSIFDAEKIENEEE
ncbi:MAG: hypothetical protein IJV89_06045 [Lentisphaeria bacterium]|nr:hypothetical protein [Lentisphaeria bacterium]